MASMDNRARQPILPPPPSVWTVVRAVIHAAFLHAFQALRAAAGHAVRGVRWIAGIPRRSTPPAAAPSPLQDLARQRRLSSLLEHLAADSPPSPRPAPSSADRPTAVAVKRAPQPRP